MAGLTFTNAPTPSMTYYSTTAAAGTYTLTLTGKITGHTTVKSSTTFNLVIANANFCITAVI
jgi:hypothetical protein